MQRLNLRLPRRTDANQVNPTTPATPGVFHFVSNPDEFEPLPPLPETPRNRSRLPPLPDRDFDDDNDSIELPLAKSDSWSIWSYISALPLLRILASASLGLAAAFFVVNFYLAMDEGRQMLLETFHTSYPGLDLLSLTITTFGLFNVFVGLLSLIMAVLSPLGLANAQTWMISMLTFSYILFIIWLLILASNLALATISFVANQMCFNEEIRPLWRDLTQSSEQCRTHLEGEACLDCLDLYSLRFLFPESVRKEDLWLCGSEIVQFCENQSIRAKKLWINCTLAAATIVVAVSVLLTSLAHRRTALAEQDKIEELKERLLVRKHWKQLRDGKRGSVGTPLINRRLSR